MFTYRVNYFIIITNYTALTKRCEMIKISNFKVNIENSASLYEVISKALGTELREKNCRIIKRSVDARDKKNIFYVYTIAVTLEQYEENRLLKRNYRKFNVTIFNEKKYTLSPGSSSRKKTVIIGSGPAGLFAAYILAEAGWKPVVLERGEDIKNRDQAVDDLMKKGILNPESNIQFGLGGAGTYSDGKLTTLVKDKLGRNQYVLDTLVAHGAPQETAYINKPHIGTDLLRKVVQNMKKTIEDRGGKFYFNHKVTELMIHNNEIIGVKCSNQAEFQTDQVILAIGHSARDTFEQLFRQKISMTSKEFSMGLRIEHLQSFIDQAQYGEKSRFLPPADYKLSAKLKKSGSLYTFCMCPGGFVVPAGSEEGMVATNGMSNYSRNAENANSALLVNVGREDFGSSHPLAGVAFQRKIEKLAYIHGGGAYKAPCQTVGSFLKGKNVNSPIKPSYLPGVTETDFSLWLPEKIASSIREGLEIFDRKIPGFAVDYAVLTGVETRSSSPVRITRNKDYQSDVRGLYPCGEGAGYAGGIMSSAMDGIKVAEAIIKNTQ
jgi:uncharacterized FAD-dependent dehydrogenase